MVVARIFRQIITEVLYYKERDMGIQGEKVKKLVKRRKNSWKTIKKGLL